MISVFKKIFGNIKYLVLAVIVAFITFVFAVWLPNLKLIFGIVFSSAVTLPQKVKFLVSTLGAIKTNFTVFWASYTVIIAILFGVNVSMFIYYLKNKQEVWRNKNAAAGLGGAASGILGIGCSTCGTFVLSYLLAFIGAGWIISFLPLGGQEFGLLGIGLLGFSIYLITKKIKELAACVIKN